jgi:hypothetical protein
LEQLNDPAAMNVFKSNILGLEKVFVKKTRREASQKLPPEK